MENRGSWWLEEIHNKEDSGLEWKNCCEDEIDNCDIDRIVVAVADMLDVVAMLNESLNVRAKEGRRKETGNIFIDWQLVIEDRIENEWMVDG